MPATLRNPQVDSEGNPVDWMSEYGFNPADDPNRMPTVEEQQGLAEIRAMGPGLQAYQEQQRMLEAQPTPKGPWDRFADILTQVAPMALAGPASAAFGMPALGGMFGLGGGGAASGIGGKIAQYAPTALRAAGQITQKPIFSQLGQAAQAITPFFNPNATMTQKLSSAVPAGLQAAGGLMNNPQLQGLGQAAATVSPYINMFSQQQQQQQQPQQQPQQQQQQQQLTTPPKEKVYGY